MNQAAEKDRAMTKVHEFSDESGVTDEDGSVLNQAKGKEGDDCSDDGYVLENQAEEKEGDMTEADDYFSSDDDSYYDDPNRPLHPYIKIWEHQQEEFCIKEIKIFLELKGKAELANKINSFDDFMKHTPEFLQEFRDKNWFFNYHLIGDFDDYKFLCVSQVKPISFSRFHMIGSPIDSDLVYDQFLNMLCHVMKYDDSDVEGLAKAKELRDVIMRDIDDTVLETCVEESKTLAWRRQIDKERVVLLSELFIEFEIASRKVSFKKKGKMTKDRLEKEVFLKVLSHIAIEKRSYFPLMMEDIQLDLDGTHQVGPTRLLFDSFLKYLKSQPKSIREDEGKKTRSLSNEERKKNLQLLVVRFSIEHLRCPLPSLYISYVTEKLKMAATLGLIEKEVAVVYERDQMFNRFSFLN